MGDEIVSVFGKYIDDMTRDELIHAVKTLARAVEDMRKVNLARTEFRADRMNASAK